MWEDYVAGTDPYDPDDVFTATIKMEDGVPVVRWSPDLPADRAAARQYTTRAAKALGSAWEDVSELTDDARQTNGYKFFKVDVDMK